MADFSATGQAAFDELGKQYDANDGDAWKAARSTGRVVGHNVGKAVAVAAAAAACGTVGSVVPGVGTAIGAIGCGYLAGVLADFADEVLGPIVDDMVDAIGDFFGFTNDPPPPSYVAVMPGPVGPGQAEFALTNTVRLLQRARLRFGLPGPYSTTDVLQKLKRAGLPMSTRTLPRDLLTSNSMDFSDVGSCKWNVPKELTKNKVSVTECTRQPRVTALPASGPWTPAFFDEWLSGTWDRNNGSKIRPAYNDVLKKKNELQSKGTSERNPFGDKGELLRDSGIRFTRQVVEPWLKKLREIYATELLSMETTAAAITAEKAFEKMMNRLTQGLAPRQKQAAVRCLQEKKMQPGVAGLGSITSAVTSAARAGAKAVRTAATITAREQAMNKIIDECRAVGLRTSAVAMRSDAPPTRRAPAPVPKATAPAPAPKATTTAPPAVRPTRGINRPSPTPRATAATPVPAPATQASVDPPYGPYPQTRA